MSSRYNQRLHCVKCSTSSQISVQSSYEIITNLFWEKQIETTVKSGTTFDSIILICFYDKLLLFLLFFMRR